MDNLTSALQEYMQALRKDPEAIDADIFIETLETISQELKCSPFARSRIDLLRFDFALCPYGHGHWLSWCEDSCKDLEPDDSM